LTSRADSNDQAIRWTLPGSIVAIVLFLAAIALPIVAHYVPKIVPKVTLDENRKLKKFPKLRKKTIETFPAKFEAAYSERFGFRDWLVYWNNALHVFLLRDSPTPRVVLGKEGWLYYASTVKDYRGLVEFPAEDIEQWRREFTAKAAFFAQRNIRYVVLFAPDKENVYPEFLPDRIQRVRDHSRLDQFLAAAGSGLPVEIIYLRDPLLQAKQELGRCYLVTDSHWNDIGGFAGAREIARRLRAYWPDLPTFAITDYAIKNADRPGGDLAKMLGFQPELREDTIKLRPQEGYPTKSFPSYADAFTHRPDQTPVVYVNDQPGRTRRAILTSDSFGVHLAPFLAQHFGRMAHIYPLVPYEQAYHEFLPRLIEIERPDVYIELLVERNLGSIPEHVFGDAKPSRSPKTDDP
jgi:alginate O-acetyltransferase complex protein AlgJ